MIHSAGLQATYVAEAETIDAMLKLVSSGVGHCILPSRIPDRLLADYGLRKVSIDRPALRRRVVVISSTGKVMAPLPSDLLACVLQVAEQLQRST